LKINIFEIDSYLLQYIHTQRRNPKHTAKFIVARSKQSGLIRNGQCLKIFFAVGRKSRKKSPKIGEYRKNRRK
jgi:hypothetical protein